MNILKTKIIFVCNCYWYEGWRLGCFGEHECGY